MPLAPGTLCGPYEILHPIGAGGMGDVYQARDTRLGRIVALKVSKEAFSERFAREARTSAALNHPNICQLYDVGPDYLVMEFIEGEPIRSVDSTRKLLDIAAQIADGLAAAHAAGIIHRDLKPDNIFLTRNGRVKILDFGLAKTVVEPLSQDDATRKMELTDAGTMLGTIAYMSPEQARGSADLRPQSDQFSFGLVLYELITSRRAFPRDSAVEVMTAIIREEADPLPANVPAPLRWTIERLLAKEPTDRYESTGDLYRELRQLRDRLAENTSGIALAPTAALPSPAAVTRRKPWMSAAVAGLALLSGVAGWMLHPAGGLGNARFTPMEVSWENPSGAFWSPDGKAFTYTAGPASDRHLFLRYGNAAAPVTLAHNATLTDPFGWSADSKRVLFINKLPANSKSPMALYSLATVGGEPEMVMPLDKGLIWLRISPDGTAMVAIYTDENRKLGISTASPVGSPMKPYSPAPFATNTFSNQPTAQFSPDMKSIILLIDALEGRQVWKLPYPAGQSAPERILKGLPETNFGGGSWFPGGRTGIWSFAGHLWKVGLNSGLGPAVTKGITSESQTQPAISPDGKQLLFRQATIDYMIVSANLSDASVERVISSQTATGMPAWASHRTAFVFASDRSGTSGIWMRSEDGDRPIVTAEAFPAGSRNRFVLPVLSPRADRVAYTRDSEEQMIWISSLSGGPPVRLTNSKSVIERGGSWSPDGGRIVYWQFAGGSVSLMIAKTSGDATPVVLREKAGNPLPEWSPDGQWIKFVDAKDGAFNPGWSLLSTDGKTVRVIGEPNTIEMTFSADSKMLYGIRNENDHRVLYSLDIETKRMKTIGEIAREHSPSSYSNPGIRLSLSPDGKSILYPALWRTSSLWMLEGFEQPGWRDWLRESMPW